jgi:chromosomal replication initiator protein
MEQNYEIILNSVHDLLKTEIATLSYETWIKPIKIHSINNNIITLVVRDSFGRDMISSKYKSLITNAFNIVLHKECELEIILISEVIEKQNAARENSNSENSIEKNQNPDSQNFPNKRILNSNFNPKYTFETFVVGENNRLAHAACLSIAEDIENAYSPLFLYGPVGLGKTHLMHAIGNKIMELNKDIKVLYITTEQFVNDFINTIHENPNFKEKFREKYRNIDILLIDDIQFLAKKTGTQEEFFHTFNSLHADGKHIIISSDRPPKDIQDLSDRLTSRFSMRNFGRYFHTRLRNKTCNIKKKNHKRKIYNPRRYSFKYCN